MMNKNIDRDKLNSQVNEQLEVLLQLLRQRNTKDCSKEVEESFLILDYYAKQLESEFLDDVLYIIKMLYHDKKGE